ncbi:hypothetical protein Ahy_A05g022870 [Arachis hypogaea]|uniref:Uncharacterized protein n=1 Tax=Arachis hypogaea TaxID=3818 RepID=A0A445D1V6_ARAHY|nr:hypothetical protein Ahy_A05g022870 [Arachis hypogaea]
MGLRVLRTNAEVMRMCESVMKNENTIYLYFDHPIDANRDIIKEDVVSDGSNDSVYKINPPADNLLNKKVSETNEKENEDVVEVNKGNEVMNEANVAVNERNVEVNKLNEGMNGAMNEAANKIRVASAPEKGVKKVRKRQPRPPPNSLSQQRITSESGQAKIVDEATHENDVNDADNEGANEGHNQIVSHDANEGVNMDQPIMDKIVTEEVVIESTTHDVTQTYENLNRRRNHLRPQPSRQRIVLGRDNEAPRIEVPNPNRDARHSGP